MTHAELLERYQAMEKATSLRLKTFNEVIRTEAKSKYPDMDKVSYLKEKRVEVDRLLSHIRTQLSRADLTQVDYQTVCNSYLTFNANF
jgi:hypothetical protein